eukprot:7698950-Pyramimonas_sp.AAC.1
MDWLQEVLQQTPSRSSPIICLDLNDGMGQTVTENGKGTEFRDSTAIHRPGSRREHYAGRRFREILEGHHMVATTMQKADDTWYGNCDNSSLVDYICIPTALEKWETSCG